MLRPQARRPMLRLLGRSDLRPERRPRRVGRAPRRHPRADGPHARRGPVDREGPREVRPHHRQRRGRGGASGEGFLRYRAATSRDVRRGAHRRPVPWVLLPVARDARRDVEGVRTRTHRQDGQDGLRPALLDAPDARQGGVLFRDGDQIRDGGASGGAPRSHARVSNAAPRVAPEPRMFRRRGRRRELLLVGLRATRVVPQE